MQASVLAPDAACPSCGGTSGRVHSRYDRYPSAPAIGGQETVIRLQVRRFFCGSEECSKQTFAEQVVRLASPHARRTPLQRGVLEKIAFALGSRPGRRLARRPAAEVARMTLLRLVRALPIPELGALSAVGADGFAFRRGRNYGGTVVDMHTHRPVDVLPDRLGDTFAGWLRAHPGPGAICRERAGGYAEGARLGALEAIQVAGLRHPRCNLTDAVDEAVRAHRKRLRDQLVAEAVAQSAPSASVTEGRPAGSFTRQPTAPNRNGPTPQQPRTLSQNQEKLTTETT
ncbi:transposase family protein [Amycolatopsis sp. NPDC059090]|uniref:transposase family protein n=1 Tax=Amycolatopsis sp. NPDC059090 TaxID=3346723 RepID=UPI00366DFFC0